MGNYLDTRDLQARLEELEAERDELQEAKEEAHSTYLEATDDVEIADLLEEYNKTCDALIEWDEENGEELKELQDMAGEISEWLHGETLIPEDDFVDYVEELLKDCGELPQNTPWYIAIDWEKTADNIKADYVEVTYQGTTYLARSC